MNKTASMEWLTIAYHDLKSAQILYDAEHFTDSIGSDLQQAIEKIQVMLDNDLAYMYQVETKQLNRAVSRNIDRFPERFRFQLTQEEYDDLRFQNGTSSSEHGGRRYLPYVFTERGFKK